MKIGVIQLSDVHIHGSTDAVLRRGREIVASALGAIPLADGYVLALSGDVAFSGKVHQYEAAQTFIGTIQEQFQKAGRQLYIAVTPGNHDSNFELEPDTRPLLLTSLRDNMGGLDPRGEAVKQLVSVQTAFFDFEASVTNEARVRGRTFWFVGMCFQLGVRYCTSILTTQHGSPQIQKFQGNWCF